MYLTRHAQGTGREEKIDKGISFKPFSFKILRHECFGNKAKERTTKRRSRGVDTKTFCGEPRVFDTNQRFCLSCALLPCFLRGVTAKQFPLTNLQPNINCDTIIILHYAMHFSVSSCKIRNTSG